MHLRFAKDRRALVWAFGLFPLVPLLIIAWPRFAWWLLPLSLYASYCAGVLSHNHVHTPVFRERQLNRLYSSWLSFFYGCPNFAWIPTHLQNHHRYQNGPGDNTSTARYSSVNTLWAALSYPTRSTAWQWPEVKAYALRTRVHGGSAYHDVLMQTVAVLFGHTALLACVTYFRGTAGGTALFVCFTLPALLAPSWMMFTNYLQHVECDASSPDNHSRNFVNRFFNWLTFDNGYHTVHHETPGLHWSLLHRAHQARVDRIAVHLNPDSIASYCFHEYVAAPLRRRFRRARADSALAS
jgi:beta-carotene hydroxylase